MNKSRGETPETVISYGRLGKWSMSTLAAQVESVLDPGDGFFGTFAIKSSNCYSINRYRLPKIVLETYNRLESVWSEEEYKLKAQKTKTLTVGQLSEAISKLTRLQETHYTLKCDLVCLLQDLIYYMNSREGCNDGS